MYSIVFDPIALAEYKHAVKWYKEHSAKAASDLVTEVRERIWDICHDPLRYRNTYRDLRELSLKKYPYFIVYLVDDKRKKIVITSFYHHKKNPKKKYKK